MSENKVKLDSNKFSKFFFLVKKKIIKKIYQIEQMVINIIIFMNLNKR